MASVLLAGAATLLLLALPGPRTPDARAADPQAEAKGSADGPVLVAGSICEAHELKERAAKDPSLRIEIPPEYDKAYPSEGACRSHAAAWDDSAPGPRQPIPFSHRHHAGRYQIPCLYCHSGTDRSPAAGVPPVSLCMGCHSQFSADFDELEGIRILKEHWKEKRTIEWKRIHRLPEYVKFTHERHVHAGVECQRCHGPVQDLDKLYLVPDTIWWPWGVPAAKLEMGWCINCHRENGAPQDCLTCHR